MCCCYVGSVCKATLRVPGDLPSCERAHFVLCGPHQLPGTSCVTLERLVGDSCLVFVPWEFNDWAVDLLLSLASSPEVHCNKSCVFVGYPRLCSYGRMPSEGESMCRWRTRVCWSHIICACEKTLARTQTLARRPLHIFVNQTCQLATAFHKKILFSCLGKRFDCFILLLKYSREHRQDLRRFGITEEEVLEASKTQSSLHQEQKWIDFMVPWLPQGVVSR